MDPTKTDTHCVRALEATPAESSTRTDSAVVARPSQTDGDTSEQLNFAERCVARLGEWVGVLSEWWEADYAPVFAGNTRLATGGALFADELGEQVVAEAQ